MVTNLSCGHCANYQVVFAICGSRNEKSAPQKVGICINTNKNQNFLLRILGPQFQKNAFILYNQALLDPLVIIMLRVLILSIDLF